jgi:hypothetical protein
MEDDDMEDDVLFSTDPAEPGLFAEDPPEEDWSGTVTPTPMDEPVELPGPSDGVWELAIMPALESLSDDEDSNMPRLQFYGTNGHKLRDDDHPELGEDCGYPERTPAPEGAVHDALLE